MENMNNQGKRLDQYKNSTKFAGYGILGMLILLIIITLLSGCYGTYYITDAEYDDMREEHLAVTYHNNSIYWGWSNGFYYYYGQPHYYPWYYYYTSCPPSYYNISTHIIVVNPVKRPNYRPNKSNIKPTHRPTINVKPNVNRNNKIKVNTNRNKVIIKNNRSNNSNKRSTNTRRRPK